MPLQTLTSSVFKINDIVFQRDDMGYYLSMNINNCDAAVLCISERGPIRKDELDISERELSYLLRGHKITRENYTLQGITRQQMAGAGRFRNFEVSPPSFIQVWGMKEYNLEINLFIPDSPDVQSAAVPQLYSVQIEDNCLLVQIDKVNGYHDGDLMYQIGNHLPIPIPATGLNKHIPLRTVSDVKVFAADSVKASYKITR